jgi:glycyl-tRNA synthetase beta subunit
MTVQYSFTKAGNELLPGFRKKMMEAESTEDVKKFFTYAIAELFRKVSEGQMELDFTDISLQPEEEPPFLISETVRASEEFASVWNASDLLQIVSRFAEIAVKHFKHLAKNPQKTESKIRM